MENSLVIDARYNKEKEVFEVFSVADGIETIMLTQTHDEIIMALKQMVVTTLSAMSDNNIYTATERVSG
jgi:hypothetical protein